MAFLDSRLPSRTARKEVRQMTKAVDVKIALEDAVRIQTVLEANPHFKVGKFGLEDLQTAYRATKELFDEYTKKEFELSGPLV
jgi:hypothetical protein